ncbi:MAG: chemotaxis protein MotB [Ignavibacteria bacterium]|nr:MAG: chemotaxis protein MotB [Ignavibacteria bacterium]KAF0160155.1 MAG: chemotaxis protein MotB [Ignavibacteria bacterium]
MLHDEGEKDRYLITYADLITLLLGLFIILYASSVIDATKYKGIAAAFGNYLGSESVVPSTPESKVIIEPKDVLSSELSKLIAKSEHSSSVQLEETERGITVSILDDVLFEPGQATLAESSKKILREIAQVIKLFPNDIRIEGHSDNTPINTVRFPSNWHLASARAVETAYYLIDKEGLDPDKTSSVSYGEYKPKDTNITPEGRAKNRRVDLVILK